MQKALLLIAALLSAPAYAQVNVNLASDFSKAKDSQELRFYLYGAYAAFGLVNTDLSSGGGKQLYCQPYELSDTDVDIVSLVERQLPLSAKVLQGDISGLPIEFVLLDALQRTFPCGR